MIPIKIISVEEARAKGLTENKQSDKGNSVCGAMVIGSTDKDGNDKITEKYFIKTNGKKELVFMAEERKQEMKDKGNFEDYLDQFETIEGKSKEEFLRE